jgi:hypothetical protein
MLPSPALRRRHTDGVRSGAARRGRGRSGVLVGGPPAVNVLEAHDWPVLGVPRGARQFFSVVLRGTLPEHNQLDPGVHNAVNEFEAHVLGGWDTASAS